MSRSTLRVSGHGCRTGCGPGAGATHPIEMIAAGGSHCGKGGLGMISDGDVHYYDWTPPRRLDNIKISQENNASPLLPDAAALRDDPTCRDPFPTKQMNALQDRILAVRE